MHDNPDLHLLRTTADLESVQPVWTGLWHSDLHATPFQHPAWLLPWWRQFGQPDLRAIAISQRGDLIGLLPFYIYRDPHTGTRQLLLLGAGTSDYLDGIFAPSCSPAHICGALHLLDQDRAWDTANLAQLRPGSKLLHALTASHPKFSTQVCRRMPALRIAELPRKIRQNVLYNRNRAHRQGSFEFVVADQSSAPAFFDALVRLHAERWNRRGQSGVLSDSHVLAWHREAIPQLARDGLLHLSALRLNGETIAAMYCLVDPSDRADRTLYIYLPAFSPHHSRLSPGTLLLAHAIEDAANHGVRIIDMLRGDEAYKQLWHTEEAPTWGFEIRAGALALPADLEEAA